MVGRSPAVGARRWFRGRAVARGRRSVPAAAQRADLAAFRWVAGWRRSALDVVLPRLSRAANHSVLWMGIAAGMAATGGRFGRRAAARGMLTLGATSAIVNLPAKLLARRERPVIDVVPEVRRLVRLPISTSFPSGHSASAAAFATGVALEKPRLAGPVAALAAAVAFSRVYTGVHYPGDVLAGAAIGAGIAWGSRHVWEVTPAPQEQEAPAVSRIDLPRLPAGDGLVVVANPDAGPALGPEPVAELTERLPAARIVEVGGGDDLTAVLADAAASARVLGVAGGDGSVNAAAAAASAAGTPLAVLPGGTLNHLARDLGIASADDVARAVEDGRGLAMDVATVDADGGEAGSAAPDRPFCNVACVGVYPELVDARERLRAKVGEWPALVGSLLQTLRGAAPVRLEIDGRARAVWLLFVGNCRYEGSGIAPAWRRRLDDGLLDVRVVDAEVRWARTRLLLAVATGTLERSRVYRRSLQTEVCVRSTGGPLRVSRDGEVFDCDGAFTVRKLAEPLSVYAPHR